MIALAPTPDIVKQAAAAQRTLRYTILAHLEFLNETLKFLRDFFFVILKKSNSFSC